MPYSTFGIFAENGCGGDEVDSDVLYLIGVLKFSEGINAELEVVLSLDATSRLKVVKNDRI